MLEWITIILFFASLAAIAYGLNWMSKHTNKQNVTVCRNTTTNIRSRQGGSAALISVESLPASQLVLLLVTYALAGKRFEKMDRNNTEEYIEVLIFYVFAIDLELFGRFSRTNLLTQYRDEMYTLVVNIVKKIAPAMEPRVFLKQMDDRFSFYAQSYNKMMRPGGNSAQMSLDLRMTIPRVGSDLFLGVAVYGEFMDILLHVNSFLKDGIPKDVVIDVLERHVS